MMRFEHVFGTLILNQDSFVFKPNPTSSFNKHLINNSDPKLEQYVAIIDYLDLIEANKMNLVNEKAVLSDTA
jgi:hypothetical protein